MRLRVQTKLYLRLVLELAVIAAAIATVPLTVSELQGETGPWLALADWIIWSVFVIELVVATFVSSSLRAFARRNWLLVVIVVLTFPLLPSIIQLTRLAGLTRLARVARLIAIAGRGVHAIGYARARHGLVYVMTLSLLLIMTAGAIIEAVEPDLAREGFWSGVWWAIVTTTTVGYGDISPQTAVGRIVAVILMFAGIGLVSTLAATIAALFIGEQESIEHADLVERLDKIEKMLEEQRRRDSSTIEGPRAD